MVRLLRDGEPVKMSKRAGNFVTLADVVNEVGKAVVRFTMLTRKADAQMDFDFAKVVEASKDNPVFYVQYAHARICSLERKAKRSEEHTSELQSLMRSAYAGFFLKKKKYKQHNTPPHNRSHIMRHNT